MNNVITYFTRYEFILSYSIILGSIYNIIHNYKKQESLPLLGILLLVYGLGSSHSLEFKMMFAFVYILFSVSTYFGEEMIIDKTNKEAIQYFNCPEKRTAATWLFTAYLTMLINILLTVEFYWMVILNRPLPFYN